MTEEMQNKINIIMDNFDFERVERTMKFLNWRVMLDRGFTVPENNELRTRAREILNEVVLKDLKYISTSGFKAEKSEDKDGICLSLEFVLSDWSS